jgi:hypothetical protein
MSADTMCGLRTLVPSTPLRAPHILQIPCLSVHRQRQTTESVFSSVQFKKVNSALYQVIKTPDRDLRYSLTAALLLGKRAGGHCTGGQVNLEAGLNE